MGKQLDFERFIWLHGQIKENRYPSKRDLMEKFEIGARTAQRNIQFIRDRLKLPLEYSRMKGGYYYSDESFEFPNARFTEKEIMGLIIMECFAHSIPDIQLLREIDSLTDKFSLTSGINVRKLKHKISIKNIRHDKVEPNVFEAVIEALHNDKKLSIEYKAKYTQEITDRIVNPLHMLLYKGNWHLLAFCEKRKGLRNFALSGILHIRILDETISDNIPNIDIEKLIEENYGIFIHEADADKVEISLKFHKDVAKIVKNQVWFPLQNLEENDDGSIVLTFPVTDFRELEHDILKYGANLEVLKPVELREIIKTTISKMSKLY